MKYSLIILVVLFLFECDNKNARSDSKVDTTLLQLERRGDSTFVNGKYDHSVYGMEVTTTKPDKYFMCSYWKMSKDQSKSQVGSFFFTGQMVSMDSLVRKANEQSDIKQKGTVVIMSISELDSSDYFTIIKHIVHK